MSVIVTSCFIWVIVSCVSCCFTSHFVCFFPFCNPPPHHHHFYLCVIRSLCIYSLFFTLSDVCSRWLCTFTVSLLFLYMFLTIFLSWLLLCLDFFWLSCFFASYFKIMTPASSVWFWLLFCEEPSSDFYSNVVSNLTMQRHAEQCHAK